MSTNESALHAGPPKIIRRSIPLLERIYDESRAVFWSHTRLKDGEYRSSHIDSSTYRYSVNCLAGLRRAAMSYPGVWDFAGTLEAFIRNNAQRVTNPGDVGLLVSLLAQSDHDALGREGERLRVIASDLNAMRGLSLQEISWIQLGLLAHYEATRSPADLSLVEPVYKLLREEFLPPEAHFPIHSNHWYRKGFVSFGAITYFLMALHEYARVMSDPAAEELFREQVRRIIHTQGAMGEWAWFYHAYSGRILDWYEIYSVHQGAMAFLFLLPALEMGVPGVDEAIRKSYRWLFGCNEMNIPMIQDDPFFICRSIAIDESMSNSKRFLRSVFRSATGSAAGKLHPSKLTVRRMLCSYEIGWILYVWSGRKDYAEFTELQLLQTPLTSSGKSLGNGVQSQSEKERRAATRLGLLLAGLTVLWAKGGWLVDCWTLLADGPVWG